MKFGAITAVLVAAWGMVSCGSSSGPAPEAPEAKPSVFVANYPLQYFASRIGGDWIEVRFPAPHDSDPAFWEPDAAAIEACQNSSLILLNGATHEKWAERTSLPLSKVIDTSAASRDQYIPLGESITHSHGPQGQHSHGGTAFTTWLDPALARQQADAVHAALKTILPRRSADLDRNHAALNADLEALDKEFQAAMAGYHQEPLLASHPVYQYVARRYAWNLQSLHWEADEIPPPEEWEKLASLLKNHPAKVMIWEAPPQAEVEQRLTKLGIHPVPFYTCSNVPDQGDYLTVMRQNAANLKSAFTRSGLASVAERHTPARLPLK